MDLVNQLPGQLSKYIFLSDDGDTKVMMLGYQVQVLKLERRFACDLTCIIIPSSINCALLMCVTITLVTSVSKYYFYLFWRLEHEEQNLI